MRWLAIGLALATAGMAHAQAFTSRAVYLVVDLSGGPDAARYPVSVEAQPPDVDFDTCRTKELWLRLIPAGTFMMGSPDSELGHGGTQQKISREDLHPVTLRQPFYMGVFEVTQKQYELVMGASPSQFKGNTRPVEQVSYAMLRGASIGAKWPANGNVDADSFLGKLREKTGLLADLPTEAQWEYACRAGTTTALNTGENLTGGNTCSKMREAGLYSGNRADGTGGFADAHTKVGMFQPNDWGIYDLHGNVWEWCLDWYGNYATMAETDPKGASSSSTRVLRGGGYRSNASLCRSACRHRSNPTSTGTTTDGNFGFRVAVVPPPQRGR